MTTSSFVARRERPQNWPLFQAVPLSDDVGVLSLEVVRGPQEGLAAAVAGMSTVLRSSLATTPCGLLNLELVAIGAAIDSSGRVATYNAERDGLWEAFEKNGLSIPDGRRREARVQYGDGWFGFVGAIDVDMLDLAKALEVTRAVNAVCVGTKASAFEQLLDDRLYTLLTHPSGARSLLKLMVTGIDGYGFLACGFGEFDDRRVGVEIFARDTVLQSIEEEVNRVASQRS